MRQDDIDEIFNAARLVTHRRYPGLKVIAVTLTLSNNEIARLPIPELLASLASGRADRCALEEIPDTQRFTWSEDYSDVRWYGRNYRFRGKQLPVVAALIQAHRNGTPSLTQSALLEIAESESSRLRDLFRNNEAWGRLIVQAQLHGGLMGSFMISPNPPEEESAGE